jgi:hypothetical protein
MLFAFTRRFSFVVEPLPEHALKFRQIGLGEKIGENLEKKSMSASTATGTQG